MNAETEKILDLMYQSWLEHSEKLTKQKHYPSRQVYGEIIKHAQLWNVAWKQMQERCQ